MPQFKPNRASCEGCEFVGTMMCHPTTCELCASVKNDREFAINPVLRAQAMMNTDAPLTDHHLTNPLDFVAVLGER